MARLAVIVALIAAAVGLAIFVVTLAGRAADHVAREAQMGNGVQLVAYGALLVLLVGVTSGWLGGL